MTVTAMLFCCELKRLQTCSTMRSCNTHGTVQREPIHLGKEMERGAICLEYQAPTIIITIIRTCNISITITIIHVSMTC